MFDEQRECDESQSLQGLDGVNLNSHLDIFYAIFRQVVDTPHEIRFLHILQHLLRIDSNDPIRDCIWSTLEILTHRTTLIEKESDSERILRTSNVQKIACPHCRLDSNNSRKFSLPHATTLPPPPPPPPQLQKQSSPALSSVQLQNATKIPPPPPPIPFPKSSSLSKSSTANDHAQLKACDMNEDSLKPFPQQEIPVPRSKMKTINWNKIPHNKIVGQNNIWSILANTHINSPLTELNWDEMEGLFCQQVTHGSPKLGRESALNTFELRTKRDNEVNK